MSTELHSSDGANTVLQQWKREVDNLLPYGEQVYSMSLRSYADMLTGVIALGGEIFARDDAPEGSLIANNGSVTYGVILRRLGNGTLDFTIHS